STETVGVSTNRRSSASNSSRCELAKDKRLSRDNGVAIKILRRTVVRACAQIIKQIGRISPKSYLVQDGRPKARRMHLQPYKSSRASCYSGVPVFPTETRHPDGQ